MADNNKSRRYWQIIGRFSRGDVLRSYLRAFVIVRPAVCVDGSVPLSDNPRIMTMSVYPESAPCMCVEKRKKRKDSNSSAGALKTHVRVL